AKKDVENVVKYDRTDPSLIMWVIGNEVEEQNNPQGEKVARQWQDIIQNLDKTLPVSKGRDRPDHGLKNNRAATRDIAGWNYSPHKDKEEDK
ncbi:glycoside hydrolase family 2 TIM barrel-domain containing protein, partial [Ornithobacterium rhinotracheale]